MKSTKRLEIPHALLIEPDELRIFCEFISKRFGELQYDVTCGDDTRTKTSNINEVLSYENPDFRKYSSLNIMSNPGANDKIVITFGDSHPVLAYGTVRLEFHDVKEQFLFEPELVKRISEMKPWYNFITKISATMSLLVLITLFGTVISGISIVQKISGVAVKATPSKFDTPETILIISLVFGVIFIVGHYLDRAKEYFFPSVLFKIGKQAVAFNRRTKVLGWVLGWLFGGGIVTGFAINYFSKLLGY